MRRRRRAHHLVVGRRQVKPTQPSHVPRVHQGNSPGNLDARDGLILDEDGARSTARRSTGINPKKREPIDPRMPNLPPP